MDEVTLRIEENSTGKYTLEMVDGRAMELLQVARFPLEEGEFAMLRVMNAQELEMPLEELDMVVFQVVRGENGNELVMSEDENIWMKAYQKLVKLIEEAQKAEQGEA